MKDWRISNFALKEIVRHSSSSVIISNACRSRWSVNQESVLLWGTYLLISIPLYAPHNMTLGTPHKVARRNLFRHKICILSYIVCESGADWRNSEGGHVTLPLCQSMCLKFWLCSLENPFAVLVVVDSILPTSCIHSWCWRKEASSQHERGFLAGPPSRFASNRWYPRYPSVVMPLTISHVFTIGTWPTFLTYFLIIHPVDSSWCPMENSAVRKNSEVLFPRPTTNTLVLYSVTESNAAFIFIPVEVNKE